MHGIIFLYKNIDVMKGRKTPAANKKRVEK